MAWSVSWDGTVMRVVVARRLPAHPRNITAWYRSSLCPSGEWSPLVAEEYSGNSWALDENERRALLRAAQKEMRDALKQIAEGVQSSL